MRTLQWSRNYRIGGAFYDPHKAQFGVLMPTGDSFFEVIQPANEQAAVRALHGLGLATKHQDFALPDNGLVANILSFNVGVEVGQVIALCGVLPILSYWRTQPGYLRHSFATNTVLTTSGFLLVGYHSNEWDTQCIEVGGGGLSGRGMSLGEVIRPSNYDTTPARPAFRKRRSHGYIETGCAIGVSSAATTSFLKIYRNYIVRPFAATLGCLSRRSATNIVKFTGGFRTLESLTLRARRD